MPREVDGLLDTIDRLVDESLATGPVDDYNTNRYDKCWHCDRDWHGIPITERIEQMRWMGRYNETYRLADDDSPVLCPGSDFIGPVPSRTRPPANWPSSVGSFHVEVVPVADPEPRRDLNLGITVDFRADWLRRIEMELLYLLRARTQQQAQAAQSRRELVERMRAAQPHTTRETP